MLVIPWPKSSSFQQPSLLPLLYTHKIQNEVFIILTIYNRKKQI